MFTRSKSRRLNIDVQAGEGPSNAPPPPPPTGLSYQERYAFLRRKTFISTPKVDYEYLDEMQMLEEFDRLTQRVGFTRRFFDIPHYFKAYIEPTCEFLASAKVVDHERKGKCLQFNLLGETYVRSISTLARMFKLPLEGAPTITYVHLAADEHDERTLLRRRAEFWPLIAGEALPVTGADPKLTGIVHPVLRYICRIMGYTIWARGETTLRPLHDEFALLATMLRPDGQVQIPDLMLHMCYHWEGLSDPKRKEGGVISAGSFVTHLARKLGLDLSNVLHGFTACAEGELINGNSFVNYKWTQSKWVGRRRVVVWKTKRANFDMPIQRLPIDYHQPATWLILRAPEPIHQGEPQPGEHNNFDDQPPHEHPAADYHWHPDLPEVPPPPWWPAVYNQINNRIDGYQNATMERLGQIEARNDRRHAQYMTQRRDDRERMDTMYNRQNEIYDRQSEMYDRQNDMYDRQNTMYNQQNEMFGRQNEVYDMMRNFSTMHFGGPSHGGDGFGRGGGDDAPQ